MTDFTLPELGENIEEGDVVRVLVRPGDTLQHDQPVLELETDKATIEVPSSVSGVIKEVRVKPGDKVKVGQAILAVEEGTGESKTDAKAAPAKDAAPAAGDGARERGGSTPGRGVEDGRVGRGWAVTGRAVAPALGRSGEPWRPGTGAGRR